MARLSSGRLEMECYSDRLQGTKRRSCCTSFQQGFDCLLEFSNFSFQGFLFCMLQRCLPSVLQYCFCTCSQTGPLSISQVWNVTFSPDEKTILSCSLDGTARMWHTGTGDELFQIVHADTIHQGCFQPDGRRFATCSHDGVFKVWKIAKYPRLLFRN